MNKLDDEHTAGKFEYALNKTLHHKHRKGILVSNFDKPHQLQPNLSSAFVSNVYGIVLVSHFPWTFPGVGTMFLHD